MRKLDYNDVHQRLQSPDAGRNGAREGVIVQGEIGETGDCSDGRGHGAIQPVALESEDPARSGKEQNIHMVHSHTGARTHNA